MSKVARIVTGKRGVTKITVLEETGKLTFSPVTTRATLLMRQHQMKEGCTRWPPKPFGAPK
jgi:hypothetical protein